MPPRHSGEVRHTVRVVAASRLLSATEIDLLSGGGGGGVWKRVNKLRQLSVVDDDAVLPHAAAPTTRCFIVVAMR